MESPGNLFILIFIHFDTKISANGEEWKNCYETEIHNSEPSAVAADTLTVDISHHANTCKHRSYISILVW